MFNARYSVQVKMTATTGFNCWVFTGSEYYVESAVVCTRGQAGTWATANGVEITGAATAGILTKTTYGSIWAIYPYDADGTGALASA